MLHTVPCIMQAIALCNAIGARNSWMGDHFTWSSVNICQVVHIIGLIMLGFVVLPTYSKCRCIIYMRMCGTCSAVQPLFVPLENEVQIECLPILHSIQSHQSIALRDAHSLLDR